MDETTLTLRHLEMAQQELEALIDSMDSMGDLGRFLPDLRRVAAHIDADIDSIKVNLGLD